MPQNAHFGENHNKNGDFYNNLLKKKIKLQEFSGYLLLPLQCDSCRTRGMNTVTENIN